MNIRDMLIQYTDTQLEIKRIKQRIKKIEKQTNLVSDIVQNGYKRRAIVYGIDEERLCKLEIQENKLKLLENKLLEQQNDVIDYIETITETRIRQIIMYRYIDNYTWLEIAFIFRKNNKKDKSTADSVRMEHNRFLENI